MEPIIITSSSSKKRDSRFKRFLNDHCYIVDFLSASITILLCLVVLLPRVHESFLPDDDHHQNEDHNHQLEIVSNNGSDITTLADDVVPVPPEPHKHVHNHRFPIGEVLICIGFFVFYCIGLGLSRPQVTMSDQQQQLFASQRRKQSVCCSSTRCPSSVPPQNVVASACQEANRQAGDESSGITRPAPNDEQSLLTASDEQQVNKDEDCVMLLNPHHQHHTHTKHHEHQHGNTVNQQDATVRVPTKRRVNYGATGQSSDIRAMLAMVDEQALASPRQNTTIVVDEIRIVSESSEDYDQEQQWPHSLRLLLFSLVLAMALFFLDMNVLGMIRAIKVFRAASTGALLYVAFFIMIPRKSVSCNSCTEEET